MRHPRQARHHHAQGHPAGPPHPWRALLSSSCRALCARPTYRQNFKIKNKLQQTKTNQNLRGKPRAMKTHLYVYTKELFFLSLVFSYEHAERFPAFFLCLLSISRIMNAKKKTRNSRGKSRPMENHGHFYTMDFFISFTRFYL